MFLVLAQEGRWLRVLLPIRPNGSQGWIYSADVRLVTHRYRIVISLSQFLITVTDGPDILLQEPVGLGTDETPTPGGLYFIKELYELPNPNTVYGPYAYGLSGYSNVLFDFAGGPGVIGLHGNNDPSAIGQKISHGCIRMSNSGITFLAERLPLGVPVQIDP